MVDRRLFRASLFRTINDLQIHVRSQNTCKVVDDASNADWQNRRCVPRGFGTGSRKTGRSFDLENESHDDLEPHWQDDMSWLCTVDFLPSDDPEARMFCLGHHRVSV